MIFKLANGACLVLEAVQYWEWGTESRHSGVGPRDWFRVWTSEKSPIEVGPRDNPAELEKMLLKVHGPVPAPRLPSMAMAQRVVAAWVAIEKILMRDGATRHLEWRIHRAIEDALDEQAGIPPATQ